MHVGVQRTGLPSSVSMLDGAKPNFQNMMAKTERSRKKKWPSFLTKEAILLPGVRICRFTGPFVGSLVSSKPFRTYVKKKTKSQTESAFRGRVAENRRTRLEAQQNGDRRAPGARARDGLPHLLRALVRGQLCRVPCQQVGERRVAGDGRGNRRVAACKVVQGLPRGRSQAGGLLVALDGLPTHFCACPSVQQLQSMQFSMFIDGVHKTDCKATLGRYVKQGPPVWLHEPFALPVPVVRLLSFFFFFFFFFFFLFFNVPVPWPGACCDGTME